MTVSAPQTTQTRTFGVQTYLLSSGDARPVKESPLCIITKSDSEIFKTNVCDGLRKS